MNSFYLKGIKFDLFDKKINKSNHSILYMFSSYNDYNKLYYWFFKEEENNNNLFIFGRIQYFLFYKQKTYYIQGYDEDNNYIHISDYRDIIHFTSNFDDIKQKQKILKLIK